MKKADIKIGFNCNNSCLFCVQSHKREYGNKDKNKIFEELDRAKKDCDIAVFTGGEPTIREDIIELAAYAKKRGFETIQIQSNGRMFAYKDFCEKMVKAGANEFALALHGPNERIHNYLTQSRSFLQTAAGISNLKGMGQRVITNTVIVKPNYRHLPEVVRLLFSLGVDQAQLAFVHALGAAADNFDNTVPRMEMAMPWVKKAIRAGKEFSKTIMVEAIPFCLMGGNEESIAELTMPDMEIFDWDEVVADFTKARIKEGKAKGKVCPRCKYFAVCEGVWKEYPAKFGWSEFNPVGR